MIPTKYKSKLPHTLSYPIGAELISEALASVPQEAVLSVSFFPSQMILDSHLKKLIGKAPYRIFKAEFRHIQPGLTASNKFIADGWYEETWELSVYPVPRQLKSLARKALLTHGLPSVKKWLSTERTPIWLQGVKYCELSFVETEGNIIVKESRTG